MAIRDIRISEIMIALLIFGTVLTGIVSFYSDFFDTFGVSQPNNGLEGAASSANDELLGSSGIINQSSEEAGRIGGGITSGVFYLKSIWNVIKLTLGLPVIIPSIIAPIASDLGIPSWVLNLFFGLISIIIIYGIIELYRGANV